MKLIGLNGKMGVGKSTAVEVLAADRAVRVVKFAQPLYDMQEFIYERIESVHKRPAEFVKDRKLLQWLGTDWGRDTIRPSLWVDIWSAEVKYLLENYPAAVIVCDDVRFDNEAVAIKALGGTVVQIVAETNGRAVVTNGIANHVSEAGIKPELIDRTIYNTSTLADYQDSLRKLYKELRVD